MRLAIATLTCASASALLIPAARLGLRPSRCAAVRCFDEPSQALTPCGGVQKTVLSSAPEGATKPSWGAMVSVLFTGRFPNGTIFDDAHAAKPYDFQLHSGTVVDGMERGIRSMHVGESARLLCEPKWAYGAAGVGSRIPPNATLVYEVELLSWREGQALAENDDFDMDTYRHALEGRAARSGSAGAYSWSEGGEEVTIWLPLQSSERARDISCDFRPRELTVFIGDEGLPRMAGKLRGRSAPDESYWVIEEEHEELGRALQITLAKAGAFTRWDGVLVDEDESLIEEAPIAPIAKPSAADSGDFGKQFGI